VSKSQHTPGPWFFRGEGIDSINGFPHRTMRITNTDTGVALCVIPADEETDEALEEVRANSQLIAAAPELLEALQNIENDDGRIPKSIWDMRNAAISKATGGAS